MTLSSAELEEISVRRLTPDDGHTLEQFFSGLDDYEQLFGALESSAAVVTYIALPEGKTYDDKYVLGIWESEKIVGVIDLIVDYPRPRVWTVGLLVLDSSHRRRGIGSSLVAWLLKEAREAQAESLRIVARSYNSGCAEFLSKLSFRLVLRSQERDSVVFEREIGDLDVRT